MVDLSGSPNGATKPGRSDETGDASSWAEIDALWLRVEVLSAQLDAHTRQLLALRGYLEYQQRRLSANEQPPSSRWAWTRQATPTDQGAREGQRRFRRWRRMAIEGR